jgi:hypothetical protein
MMNRKLIEKAFYCAYVLCRRRPSDAETNDDQETVRTSLLSSTNINTTAQQDNIMPTVVAQDSIVSIELIPDNALVTLSFHHINYSIGNPMELNKRQLKFPFLHCFQPEEHKQILFNISGRFSKGLNAILGEIIFTLIFLN